MECKCDALGNRKFTVARLKRQMRGKTGRGTGIALDNRWLARKGQPQELNLVLVGNTNKWSDHRMTTQAAIKNPSWGQTSS